jgi:sugar phosphate isomerase/epimerase
MTYTRRDLAKLALAAPLSAAFAKMIDSKFHGVMIGSQSYSFRDRPLDECIAAFKEIGIGYCELSADHVGPKDPAEAKKWRLDPPLDEYKRVRQKFDDAGIVLYAFAYNIRDEWSDAEIEGGFKMTRAMGLNKITCTTHVSVAPRIYPFAEKYKIYVGMHNHDSVKPNEFAAPESFAQAMEGRSKYIKINLDIGHFTASNFDPVAFIEEHHADIVTLHIKDRKKDHGPNMPFGEGDTNIKGVLELLKTKRYPIPAMIEYEYGKPGMDSVVEVRKSFEYMKQALA